MKTFLISLAIGFSAWAMATAEGDEQYALKRWSITVLSHDLEPVFAEATQTTLENFIENNPRFELARAEQKDIANLLNDRSFSFSGDKPGDIRAVAQARLLPAVLGKVDAAFFAELIPRRIENYETGPKTNYDLLTILINAQTGEILSVATEEKISSDRIENLQLATEKAVKDAVSKLPFSATVLRREGYRVILDAGLPAFRKGMQVSMYTVEASDQGPLFKETGVVLLTRVERNLSFGKVISDRRPLEIEVGNKVKPTGGGTYVPRSTIALMDEGGGRQLASEEGASSSETFFTKRHWLTGDASVGIGTDLVSIVNTRADGVSNVSGVTIHPTIRADGLAKITREFYIGGNFTLGAGLSSQVNHARFSVDYKWTAGPSSDEPWGFVRLGLGQSAFGVTPSEAPLLFTSASVGGLILGGTAFYSVDPKIAVFADFNWMPLPSLTETPVTSGATTTGLSYWDFSMGGSLALSKTLLADAKLIVRSVGASFSGQGTRAESFASSGYQSLGLCASMRYMF